MRDDNGAGVMDPVKFYETVKAIRAYKDCDVIVNCTPPATTGCPTTPPTATPCGCTIKNVPGIEMGTFDALTGFPGVFHNSPKVPG